MNLRVKTMETELLGLDEHVCELLLTLRIFAELMVSQAGDIRLFGGITSLVSHFFLPIA